MRAVAARFPVAIFVYAFLGWTFDFYDLVLLGFLKDGVVHDLGMSHGMEGWLLGAGLGASGFGGTGRGRARRSLREAPRALGDGAHLLDRIVHLRRRADTAGVLPRADRPGPRHRRRVGDRPRHAGRGGASGVPRPGRRVPAGGRTVRRLHRRDRRLPGPAACRLARGAARLQRDGAARGRGALVVASARSSPRARDRSSPSCARPRARWGCPAGSCAHGCSGCSSWARTGAATRGCRASCRSRCTRASGAR